MTGRPGRRGDDTVVNPDSLVCVNPRESPIAGKIGIVMVRRFR